MSTALQLRGECVRTAPAVAGEMMRQLYATHDLEERANILAGLVRLLDQAGEQTALQAQADRLLGRAELSHREELTAAALHAEATAFALLADLYRSDLAARAKGARRG